MHLHRFAQLLVGEVLHLAVDGELKIGAVHRWHDIAHVFDHTAEPVLDHAARAAAARELLVEGQFDALLPPVFHVGEAHHVGRGLALWVLALVLGPQVDALDAERGDLVGHRLVDLALDPDKGLVLVGQALLQRRQRHAQQLGQLAQLGLALVHILRNRPDALRHHAGREDQAIAVQHPAAVGGQFQRAREAHLALTLEELVAKHLHVGRAGAQPGKGQRQCRHDELAAPDRRLARQQRACAVTDTATGPPAHGRPP